MRVFLALLFLAAAIPLTLGARQPLQTTAVEGTEVPELLGPGESHFVTRAGQRIHVWERTPTDWTARGAKVIVFMHGGTYSGRPDFDLSAKGYSVMEAFARDGYATYAVDAQGYGASDDPLEGVWCTAKEAALDLEAAVQWILQARKVSKVSLLGWSWGCQVVGEFAQANPDQVEAVVLQGGAWKTKYNLGPIEERFRETTADGAASDFVEGCYEPSVRALYVQECLRHDPDSPNGALQDYSTGSRQVLKPELWTWPTHILLGEHEAIAARQEDLAAFFLQLATPHKSFTILPGGGHAIFLEKPHRAWQAKVLEILR